MFGNDEIQILKQEISEIAVYVSNSGNSLQFKRTNGCQFNRFISALLSVNAALNYIDK
jgi:hypothetical protein